MNILLACGAGASTSLLVNKMKTAMKSQGKEYSIEAVPKSEIKQKLESERISVILIGPQIAFAFDTIKDLASNYEVPVQIIKPQDYGMCDGEKVLKYAEEIAKKEK